jgi:itaconate CoA-transferase
MAEILRRSSRRSVSGDDERFATNIARVRGRAETDALVARAFAERTDAELTEALACADIAFAHVNDLAALSRHPHLRRITIETPGGDVSYPAPAPIFVGAPRPYGPAPAIGEHSSAIARRSSRR